MILPIEVLIDFTLSSVGWRLFRGPCYDNPFRLSPHGSCYAFLSTHELLFLRSYTSCACLPSSSLLKASSLVSGFWSFLSAMMSKLAFAKQLLGAKVRLVPVALAGVCMLISILCCAYCQHGFGGEHLVVCVSTHAMLAKLCVLRWLQVCAFMFFTLHGYVICWRSCLSLPLACMSNFIFLGVSGELRLHACGTWPGRPCI